MPALRTAVYRLAQTYALDSNYNKAYETWQRFLKDFPDDPRRPLALLQHGAAARQIKDSHDRRRGLPVVPQPDVADDLLAPTWRSNWRKATGTAASSIWPSRNSRRCSAHPI